MPKLLFVFPKSPSELITSLITSLYAYRHLTNSSFFDLIGITSGTPNWPSHLRLALIQFTVQAPARVSLWDGKLMLSFHCLELVIGSLFMFTVKCHLLN